MEKKCFVLLKSKASAFRGGMKNTKKCHEIRSVKILNYSKLIFYKIYYDLLIRPLHFTHGMQIIARRENNLFFFFEEIRMSHILCIVQPFLSIS